MQGLPFRAAEIEAAILQQIDIADGVEPPDQVAVVERADGKVTTDDRLAETSRTRPRGRTGRRTRRSAGARAAGTTRSWPPSRCCSPTSGVRRENTVFVSGIGCAARFPYYMNTYGMHSIHGRAPAIATGLATTRPDLDVWVVTGDGDSLSIGGNHLIHALRRNVNLTILLFNNQIYGLTKGQYSPTSEVGKVTKSTPFGSLEQPFNPLSLALGAEATFVARTHDMDRKHMMETFRRAHQHKGASFVEIYQNCNVFNDGAFDQITGKDNRADMLIPLSHGEPIRFGAEGEHGVVLHPDGSPRGRRGG